MQSLIFIIDVPDKMSGGPTMMQSWVGMEPNWARVPPHVPTYPNPPAFFRQTAANKYTYPPQRENYQVNTVEQEIFGT